LKKVFSIIVSVVLTSLLLFYFLLENRKHCPGQNSDEVCIKLLNNSGQDIRQFTLINHHGETKYNSLMNGRDTTLQYKSKGEDSYKWIITFENDSRLESKGNYTEGGYCMVDTVTTNEIRTHYCSFFWKN
jgi:hypothetical protein